MSLAKYNTLISRSKNTLGQSAHQESMRDQLFLRLILNRCEKNVGISENAMRQRPLEI